MVQATLADEILLMLAEFMASHWRPPTAAKLATALNAGQSRERRVTARQVADELRRMHAAGKVDRICRRNPDAPAMWTQGTGRTSWVDW